MINCEYAHSQIYGIPLSHTCCCRMVSVNISYSTKTFGEQLHEWLNKPGTSVDEVIKALKDMKGRVDCFVILNIFTGF